MRIIAGEFRGRKLLPPRGDVTRPITDRVKQSLFDIVAPEIEGSIVLDMFAGTGSMGLECLSRGAKQVCFFESDPSALSRLRQNLQALNINEPRAMVYGNDIFRWFDRWEKRSQSAMEPEERAAIANLVFLDPPYRYLRDRAENLRKLADQLSMFSLNEQSRVIFRHDTADQLELPSLKRYDRREYGGMALEFLIRA